MNENNLNQFNNSGVQQNNNMNQYNNLGTQPNSPQMSNYNNYPNHGNNGFKDNKKMIYIIIGGVVLVALILILYFTVFNKDKGYEDFNDYDDYLKNEEKIKEKLNKNFTVNGFKTQDGILVELKNNNDVPIDAEIKIEFYNENGNVINVEDGYMFDTAAKGKGYDEIYVDEDINYTTYKITAKLEKSINEKTYNDKIEIISNTKQNNALIIQVKNNSDVKLSEVELGLIFIGENNTIIDYEDVSIDDFGVGETVSEKVYIPYDYNIRDDINYEKIDIVVISAIK